MMKDAFLVAQYNEKLDQFKKLIILLPSEKRTLLFEALEYIDENRTEDTDKADYKKGLKKTLKGFKKYSLLSKDDFDKLSKFFDFYYLFLQVQPLVSSGFKWCTKIEPSLFIKHRMKQLGLNRIILKRYDSGVGETTVNRLLSPKTSSRTWLRMKHGTRKALFNMLRIDEELDFDTSKNSTNMLFGRLLGLLVENEDNDVNTILIEDVEFASQLLNMGYKSLEKNQAYLLYKNFDVYWNLNADEWDIVTTLLKMNIKKKKLLINAIESADHSVFYTPNKTQKFQTYKKLMQEDDTNSLEDFEIELLRRTINNKIAKLVESDNYQQFIDFSERLLIYPKIDKYEWRTLAYRESIQKMPELKHQFILSLQKLK